MKKLSSLVAAVSLALISQAHAEQATASDKAIKLAKDTILIDTHIDVPYRIHNKWADVTKATDDGDFDYPRAVQGGLNAPFMSIYIPANLEFEGKGKSYQLANQLIDSMEAIVQRAPDKFAIADSTADIKAQFKQGKMSIAMGMENGSPIEGEMKNLKHFYKEQNEIDDTTFLVVKKMERHY